MDQTQNPEVETLDLQSDVYEFGFTDTEHEVAKLKTKTINRESIQNFLARGGNIVKIACVRDSNVVDLYSEGMN